MCVLHNVNRPHLIYIRKAKNTSEMFLSEAPHLFPSLVLVCFSLPLNPTYFVMQVVSTIAVDPTGSRVLTGGYDYSVKMFDFQGMDSRLRSFRQLEPSEGHQLRALSWSPTADKFLAVTGSAQAKIYDKDGFTQGEFIKGDMYIRDLKNTKGHISGLTGGQWHPKDRETALTSSEDGSLRIWDVSNFKSQKQVIVSPTYLLAEVIGT